MAARAASRPRADPPEDSQQVILKRLAAHLGDRLWRLNNLYEIKNQKGEIVPFRLNAEQTQFLADAHYLNIILKARQLGFTTLACILMLDACLFNSNTACGIIADTRENGEKIFTEKIDEVYDRLPDWLKRTVPKVKDRAQQLKFGNGSVIWVGVSHRGGTLQWLHISEYGKICAKYPAKAKEIRTGALNTIHAGQTIIVESTAEGVDGHFFQMTQRARAKAEAGTALTTLDFKLHFFPWWRRADYRIDPASVVIGAELEKYFQKVEDACGVSLDAAQRAWYAKKQEDQEGEMAREFPSTPDEPFFTTIEGAYFAQQLARCRTDGRVRFVPYEPAAGPVHTMWDLGLDDEMACWFVQCVGRELRFIRYQEWHDTSLETALADIQGHGYIFGKHAFPHDIAVRDLWKGTTRKAMVERTLGKIIVVPSPEGVKVERISAVRTNFTRMVFDETLCADGLKRLAGFRKKWDHIRGQWLDTEHKDSNVHGADALGTGMLVVEQISGVAKKSNPMDQFGGAAGVSADPDNGLIGGGGARSQWGG